jgi:tryptophanyl-tRNA synthetase
MTLDANTLTNATEEPQTSRSQRAEQIVNPFTIEAADEFGIDYEKLIETFGTRKIDQAILDRFEKLTGQKPHRYLRRGHFFSQR